MCTPGRCAAAESPPGPRPSDTRVLAILGAACSGSTRGARDPQYRAPCARPAMGGDGDADTRAEGPVKRRRGQEGCVHKPRTVGCAGSPQKPAEATALPTPGFQDSGPRTSVVLNHRPGVLRYSDHRKLIHIQQTSPECVLWARHHKGSQESRVNQTQQSWPRAPRGASGPPVLRSCEETEPRAAEQRPTQPGPPHLPVCASHTGEGLGPPTSMARGPPAPFYQNKTGTRDGEVKGAPLVTLRKASRAAAA